jgi:hypothetical protein
MYKVAGWAPVSEAARDAKTEPICNWMSPSLRVFPIIPVWLLSNRPKFRESANE